VILNDVITEVRRILQDTVSPQRYSDDVMLGFANQALKRIAVLRPDLFAIIADIPTTADAVVQSMPADSIRLLEIYSVKGGNGIIETNREILDQSLPTWMNTTASAAINFMRHVRNANKFFIYPKAPADQILIGEYAQVPPTYDGTTAVALLPDVYFPVVIDATVFIAESVDNEHVNSNRAQLFQTSFTQALGVAAQSRAITDTERGGLDEEDVA